MWQRYKENSPTDTDIGALPSWWLQPSWFQWTIYEWREGVIVMMRMRGGIVQEKEIQKQWRSVSPAIVESLGSSEKASLVESWKNVENHRDHQGKDSPYMKPCISTNGTSKKQASGQTNKQTNNKASRWNSSQETECGPMSLCWSKIQNQGWLPGQIAFQLEKELQTRWFLSREKPVEIWDGKTLPNLFRWSLLHT